jgi:hypothetical protein
VDRRGGDATASIVTAEALAHARAGRKAAPAPAVPASFRAFEAALHALTARLTAAAEESTPAFVAVCSELEALLLQPRPPYELEYVGGSPSDDSWRHVAFFYELEAYRRADTWATLLWASGMFQWRENGSGMLTVTSHSESEEQPDSEQGHHADLRLVVGAGRGRGWGNTGSQRIAAACSVLRAVVCRNGGNWCSFTKFKFAHPLIVQNGSGHSILSTSPLSVEGALARVLHANLDDHVVVTQVCRVLVSG